MTITPKVPPFSAQPPITISVRTLRRFILGKQGLWPGRRWQGKAGAAVAIESIGAVQIDPLVVVARAHDLKLFSRVADYQPEHLNELLYTDRRFFDYGGLLQIYPMAELPYWKLHMARHLDEEWYRDFAAAHGDLLDLVRSEIRTRGPIGHRDLKGESIASYRARKDTGLALVMLWRIGELMTAGRNRFDRLYDFADRIAPPDLLRPAATEAAESFFLQKSLAMNGLPRLTEWRGGFAYFIRRPVSADEMKRHVADQIAAGLVAAIRVAGHKDLYYADARDLPLINALEAGQIPVEWTPLNTTTDSEVNFLAPLDPVSARGRAAKLFDFLYTWEIYTPIEKRKWGYYVLPILYGETLVGRMDVKLDRAQQTMRIKGFWLEDSSLADDPQFAAALTRGLIRFTKFHAVSQLDAQVIQPTKLRAAKWFKGSGITLVKSTV